MKKTMLPVLCIFLGLLLASCGREQEGKDTGKKEGSGDSGEVTWEAGDFRDFYYTKENLNYNAFYQRYRVYEEEGRHMFFHETRQVVDDYGPATEEHTTLKGCFELTDEEWEEFLALLSEGSACPRSEHTETGSSGPWLYLYLKEGDPGGYEFSFSSYGALKDFEAWCTDLAEQGR